MTQLLHIEEVKSFYDRFGRKQDAQSFYEDAAVDDLLAHAAFESARRVFEFGCGTGRIAERIFDTRFGPQATYAGVDVSSTMVALANARLSRYGARAEVRQIDGTNPFAGLYRRPDRILSTYVLDLLPFESIASFIDGAGRVLEPYGRLCLASLTFGNTAASRIVTAGWRGLFRVSPKIVGGCRPVRVLPFLTKDTWDVAHHRVLSAFGIASEVIVAIKIGGDFAA